MADDSDRVWYYCDDGKIRKGPVAKKTIEQLLMAGSLSGDSLVWHPSQSGWAKLADVPEIRLPDDLLPPPLPTGGSTQGPSAMEPRPKAKCPLCGKIMHPKEDSSEDDILVCPHCEYSSKNGHISDIGILSAICQPSHNSSASNSTSIGHLISDGKQLSGDFGGQKGTQSNAIAGPWRRFAARWIDLGTNSLLTGFMLLMVLSASPGFAEWIQEPGSDYAFGLITLPLALIAESIIFALFGSTWGKYLLGVVVKTEAGLRPSIGQYLKRQFGVYWFALGLGLPIVSLFTMARQYRRLKAARKTRYDEGSFDVGTTKIGLFKGAAAIATAALMFLILMAS